MNLNITVSHSDRCLGSNISKFVAPSLLYLHDWRLPGPTRRLICRSFLIWCLPCRIWSLPATKDCLARPSWSHETPSLEASLGNSLCYSGFVRPCDSTSGHCARSASDSVKRRTDHPDKKLGDYREGMFSILLFCCLLINIRA